MALPKQVQAQIDEANKIAEQMNSPAEGEDASVEETPEGAPEAAADSEPSDSGLRFESEGSESAETVASEEEPEAEAASVESDAQEEGDKTWEHKYKTLQGMFNGEKRRSTELAGRIEGLESMLAKLQEARERAAPEETVQQDKNLLSAEEIDEYGSDLIGVMKRAAREAVKTEVDELRTENQQLKQVIGGVGQRQELSEREMFFSRLTGLAPGWEKLNTDPSFLGWLAERDVYAGTDRKSMLTSAFEAGDVDRAAQFFIGYLKETAAVQPATTEPTPKPAGKGKVDLASLAAPGIGGSGSADNTDKGSGREWKESEIGSFYRDAKNRLFEGREDEYRRIEREIQTAVTEGKILLGQ